ncbi:MAG: methyltransferase domain-containing protein [Oscillospiraceae bacterium]|nr:methyltransferase domain-containing protein [Oscillospiraceae bacterium]
MNYDELTAYYESSHDEKSRLINDKMHSLEYITTMYLFKKYLPGSGSVIDCCAGGGIYSFTLAKQGYEVTAGDLMKKHVDILHSDNKNGLLKAVYQIDVLDMSRFESESFDIVLCMGALYHIMKYDDRQKCVSECLRLLKRGGCFVAAYVNRNAVYINHFNQGSDIEKRRQTYQTGKNGIFYAMDFGESDNLMNQFPLVKITNAGVDGLIYPLKERLNSASKDDFDDYLQYHLASCEQPSIIGHSMHGLYIGRKTDGR